MPTLSRLIEPLMAPVRRRFVNRFESLPRPDVDVLLIGDSITAQGRWEEGLPGLSSANRGIPGDRTQHVLNRLDSVGRGRVVCVLIGTNDLSYGIHIERIAQNVQSLIGELRRRMPDSTILLQSVMPRCRKYSSQVLELNARYRGIAAEAGVRYVDLWQALSDGDGALQDRYTLDKLHLNGFGNRAWLATLSPVIRQAMVTDTTEQEQQL